MPRIMGLSIVGILVAGIVYWLLGYVWYGMVFMDPWMAAHGIPAEGEMDPMVLVLGVCLSLLSATGIAWALQRMRVSEIKTCILRAVGLWAFFAMPAVFSSVLYAGGGEDLLWIDGSYTLVGFVIMAAILAFFGTQPKMEAGDVLD